MVLSAVSGAMLLEERWQALQDEGGEVWHLAPID
jgi:hypothetical protein